MEGGNSSDSRQVEYPESARGGRSRPGLEGPACKYSTWRHKTPLSSHVFVLRFSPQSPFCWDSKSRKGGKQLTRPTKSEPFFVLWHGQAARHLVALMLWPGAHPSIHPSYRPLAPFSKAAIYSFFQGLPGPRLFGRTALPRKYRG
jgi:hypothetical protein